MLLGGFGFLSRLHGLSIDNLVEAEVVLADGSIVIVNEKEHPGRLLVTSSAVNGARADQEKSRPLVGFARRWSGTLRCDSLQSAGVPGVRRLCRKLDLVRLPCYLSLRFLVNF
jgi:hypothetical protein